VAAVQYKFKPYLALCAVQYSFTHKHPVAAVQYTFTHKQDTEYRELNILNNKKKKIGYCGPCPVCANYSLAFALQLRKNYGKTSVRVIEKRPDIPVAEVQYICTHKQYTEQHNETEYTTQ
jgi:hypothetical protein